MVFNNKSLLKLMGVDSAKDLHGLLTKTLFTNREHGYKLSLLATVNSRCSDKILGQSYTFQQQSQTSHVLGDKSVNSNKS